VRSYDRQFNVENGGRSGTFKDSDSSESRLRCSSHGVTITAPIYSTEGQLEHKSTASLIPPGNVSSSLYTDPVLRTAEGEQQHRIEIWNF
jgi:hypothetical protein